MFNSTKFAVAWAALFIFLTAIFLVAASWAQEGTVRLDSGHSTASLTLVSTTGRSWNVGITKVSGSITLNNRADHADHGRGDNDREYDAIDLNLYPAGEASRLLNAKGDFRGNSFADLSRYATMSFRSSSISRDRDGNVAFIGELALTYVHREPNISWSAAYSGPDYSPPVAQTTTHAVTFVFPAQEFAYVNRPDAGMPGENISAHATINLRDFPRLKRVWMDSVWPLVVEDEHCVMPWAKADLRDYSGAVCTGTPVLPQPLSQPPERFGLDYPGPNEVTAPLTDDEATIVLNLRLDGRK
jgi:polyisoprenoid-binding protein YceI